MAKKPTVINRAARGDIAHASDLLRDIALHIAPSGEPEFFSSLARYLAHSVGATQAYVAEIVDAAAPRARTIAVYAGGAVVPNSERNLADGAGQQVLRAGIYLCRDKVREQFPNDRELELLQAESYVGAALYDSRGQCIGLIAAMSRQPLTPLGQIERTLAVLAARAAAELERRHAHDRVPRLNRLLRAMRAITKTVGRENDAHRVYEETCRVLVEQGGYRMAWVGLLHLSGKVQPAAQSGITGDYLERVRLRHDAGADGQGPTVSALQTGRHAVSTDLTAVPRAPWAEGAYALGCRACAAFPLYKRGRVIGAITLYAAEPGAFEPAETDLLDDLTADVSQTLQALEETATLRGAQEQLHESQRIFSTLLSNLPGMVYRCRNDRDWTMEFVSDGSLDITGYPPSDFVDNRTRSYAQLIVPEDRQRVWDDVQAALSARTPFQLVYRIRTADDVDKWVWEQGRGVYGASGELLSLEGFITDITERKRAEEALRASEERFKSLTELSSDWYWEQDAQLRFTLITHNVDSPVRPPREITLGRRRWELSYYPDMSAADWAPLKGWQEAREPFEDFLIKRRWNGELRYNIVSGVPIFDAAGNFRGYRGTGRDVTERIRAEEEMRKLSSAVQQTADSVIITDRSGSVEYVNAAFEQITGYTRAEALGQNAALIKSGLHEAGFYERMWGVILAGETFRDVFINRRKNGEVYYEEKTISPLRSGEGEITHFIATGKDITDRMQAQERLHYLAHYDALTDLPNRVLFLDRLNQALIRSHWHQCVVAVLFLDLDRFKYINDTLGHDIGDGLLKALTARLQKRVREGDTVARLGGDEFAILLEDISQAEDVSTLAAKLLDVFGQPFVIQGHELYITASIGISLSPNDGSTAAALLKNADTAMYRAKDVGKNNYQYYSADMSAAAFERLTLETSLRRALERQEFLLHYQPQIDLASGRVMGVEALVRWQHPEFGLLGPAHFISLAEENGAIVPIGEWVLRTAMTQAKRWREAGHPELCIAVNVSGRQFNEPNFVETLARLLSDTGLPASALELEITESVIMQNAEKTIERLRVLHEMGLRFAIDDFGTGYSSLSYLRRFPIHTLKIYKSFIRDLTEDGGDAEIVKTIIAMARNLKLEVVAEGVETREQLTFLQAQDCYAAQGYFLSRPLPVERMTERLMESITSPWLAK